MGRIILLMSAAVLVLVSAPFAVSAAGAHKFLAAGAQKQATRTVVIQGFAFKPAHITITRGTKVTWVNKDMTKHTATANNARSFDSGVLRPEESYSHTFKRVGKQGYHCQIHPSMMGSVAVKR